MSQEEGVVSATAQGGPESFDLRSADPVEARAEELRRLFPEAFTEGGKVDFDRLRLALGGNVNVSKERYGLTWPGRAECFKTIQAPSLGTLRPCPQESVDWDTTENLIIEGDNLEVLKLLQKSYLGKVKMIYIDPPYNTGNDFIYPDNYTESLQTYLEYTGQVDAEGKKFSTNTDTDGRFHSKWLDMMYPRLYLARNLLREDGAIFVSIDDHELTNLVTLMSLVFGEENHLGTITVVSNWKGRSDSLDFASCHDYFVAFAKSSFQNHGLPLRDDIADAYRHVDAATGRRYRLLPLRKSGSSSLRSDRPNMFFSLFVDPESLVVRREWSAEAEVEVWPLFPDGREGRWRWGPDTALERLGELVGVDVRGRGLDVYEMDWIDKGGQERRLAPKSTWTGPEYSSDRGTYEVKELLGEGVFDHPKPVGLIDAMLQIGTHGDDIVLDFFAGSGSTGEAVLRRNLEDGGGRRFVLVQLPEPTQPKSPAAASGFVSIADITRERVRRVTSKMNEGDEGALPLEGQASPDRGFRAFKLDESNFTTWDAGTPEDEEALAEQLELHADHVREQRSDQDLLFELLLKSGFPLATPVQQLLIADVAIYSVVDGQLVICLSRRITQELIDQIANLDPRPERVVCLDEGFAGNDQLKVNANETFRTKGILTFNTV